MMYFDIKIRPTTKMDERANFLFFRIFTSFFLYSHNNGGYNIEKARQGGILYMS